MSSSVVCAENASLLAQHVCSSVNHMAHIYVTSQTYAHMMQSDSRERLDLVPVLTFLPPTSATLCSWFHNNSELTKIDLSNQGALHYRQVEILIEFLRQTTTLQELNLSGCLRSSGKFHNVPQDVVDDARNDLKVQIGKNEALLRSTCDEKSKATLLKFPEEISLENRDECIDLICMITFDGFLQVLLSLIENTSILRLNLSQNDIGCMESSIERCHLLARYIDWNETLTYLNLSDNSLLNSHFAILSKGLTKNIKLSTIDISGNGIDRDSEFSLENEVNEEDAVFGPLLLGLEGMGEVVQKNKFLRDIILRRNELSVQDVALPIDETACCDQNLFKFIEPFRRYNRLRLLDLSSNFLGDTGIALLCHVLEKNKSLKHLYLGDNDMSFDGLTGVTSLLKKTELECLSLRNSKLDALDIGKPRSAKKMNTKVGVKAFERATHILQDFVDTLRRNLSLVTIDLAFCHLGSNAMKSICCALASRPIQMQHLDISGNNIGAVSSQEDLATFFSTELLDKCISLNLGWNFFEFADILLPLSNSCGSVKMLEVLVLSRAGFNNKVTLISHPPLKFKECIFPQTLTELDLSHNSDRQAIAALLMHLKVERQSLRLENLNVSYTSLNFDEIQTLCDSKWAQQQGKKIWMKGNLICDKGLAKLGSFLGVAKNLLVLDLGGAACSFDALISFFQNVRTNHLQILEIWSVHATVNSKLLKQIISFCEANTKLYYLELNIQQSGACWDNEDFCVLLQRMKEILRIKI